MMEPEYISDLVWLSLKAIYSKLFLESICGLLSVMTARMHKEATDPKKGPRLIQEFIDQYSINVDEVSGYSDHRYHFTYSLAQWG